jgi:ATP-binding cassette subfamily F protein 3
MGTLKPTKGAIVRHPLLKIGYFSQHSVEELSGPLTRASSDGPVTALSYFMEHFAAKGETVVEQDARKCLGSFGLQGKIASDTPLSQLSGGQKVPVDLVSQLHTDC